MRANATTSAWMIVWIGAACAPGAPATRPATAPAAVRVMTLAPSTLVIRYREPWREVVTTGGRRKLAYAGRAMGIVPLVSPIGHSAGGVYQSVRPGTATPCVRHYLESLLERLMETADFKDLEPAGPTERIAGRGIVGVFKPMKADEGKGRFRYCGVAMFCYRGHSVALVCVARGGRNLRREQELFRRQLRGVGVGESDATDSPFKPPEVIYVQSASADPRSPSELFATDLENRRVRRLTRLNARAREPIQAAGPRVSPDGRQVLFASNLRGGINLYPWAIWAVDTRGRRLRRLTGLIGNLTAMRRTEDRIFAAVTGTVTDAPAPRAKPVAGALVFAGGMVKPAVTDADGRFSIQVPEAGWTWLRIDPPRSPEGKPQPLRRTARWLKPRKAGANEAGAIPLSAAGAARPQDLVLGEPAMDPHGGIYWIRRLRRLGAGAPATSADFPWDLRTGRRLMALQKNPAPDAGADPSRGYWLDESQLWRLARTPDGWIEVPVTFRFWGRRPSPVFSRDGKWMAVKTCRLAVDMNAQSLPAYQDTATIMLVRISGDPEPWKSESLEVAAAATGGLAFTPDSSELLYVAAAKGKDAAAGNLMALDLAKRTSRPLTAWTRPAIGGISVSPDGSMVAFDAQHTPLRARASEPMRTDVYVIPTVGGVASRITNNGVSSQPAWSAR